MKRRPYPPLGGKELSSKHETGRGDVGGKKLSHCPFFLSPLSPPSLYPVFTTASQASSSLQARKTNTVPSLTATKILDICIFFSVKKPYYTCVVRLKADRHEGFPGFAPGARSGQAQSSPVCTSDFMDIIHSGEQNFHPAKCSTTLNRLST